MGKQLSIPVEVTWGEVRKALIEGKRATDLSWNGKGMYIFAQVPSIIPITTVPKMQSLPDSVKQDLMLRASENPTGNEFQTIRYENQIALVKADNTIEGWSPSVKDSLSTTWIILD